MEPLKAVLSVAIGGSAGALARYYVSIWAAGRWGEGFPYGTLIVNVIGCFIIGCFMVMATERAWLSPYWRLLIATGFLGGLTTFSSFGYETLMLIEEANVSSALYNVMLNLAAGIAATWLGVMAARLV